MNGATLMLATLRDGESRLADDLQAAARRHRDEAEIRHVATDLARWSHEHAERLADAERKHGVSATADSSPGFDTTLVSAPARTGEASDAPSPIELLRDLVGLHTAAEANRLYWDMLTGLAKATKEDDLLELAETCGPRSLRQATWARSMIKVLSPQILSSL